MSFHRSLEMSISREEFFRLLPAAVGPFVVDGDTVRRTRRSRGWLIRLTPLADHRVGSVVVPRHRVEIVLEACSRLKARPSWTASTAPSCVGADSEVGDRVAYPPTSSNRTERVSVSFPVGTVSGP